MSNPEILLGVAVILYFGGFALFWEHWVMWLLANCVCVATFYFISLDIFTNISLSGMENNAFIALVFSAGVLLVTYILYDLTSDDVSVIRGTKLLALSQINRKSRRKAKEYLVLGKAKLPISKSDGIMVAVIGETGSGKTQAILALAKQIQSRGERIIAFDPAGDLFQYLYKDGDHILSTEDERSVAWSPHAEIHTPSDCLTVAEGLIGGQLGESKAWYQSAHQFSSDLIWSDHNAGKRTNADLVHSISETPVSELSKRLANTSSARYMEKGSDKQLGSILGIASSNFRSLRELDQDANETSFSIREYCGNLNDSANLWVTYSDLSAALTLPLRRCWSRLIIRSLISGTEINDGKPRRTWLILDELASNGALDDLELAASRGRKYGLSVIVGMQGTSQLDQIYGHDATRSLLSNFGDILVLRSPEEKSARQLSSTIGSQEIERTVTRGNGRKERVREGRDAILSAQIMALPNLAGFLKVGELGWTRIVLPIVSRKMKKTTRFNPTTKSVAKVEIKNRNFDEI